MSLLLAAGTGGGGVAYTLSGEAGTYTITGQSATFKVDRFLSGSNGTYAITGQNGSFRVDRNLSGSSGTYTISGQDGTLTYTPGSGKVDYVLSGESGSYSITGFNGFFGYTPQNQSQPEQASNWQAFRKFKKQKLEEWQAGDFIETPKATPEQIRAQREALGILPPETHRKAQEAVRRAVEVQVYKPADNAAQNAIEAAREQAASDWIEAYREALIESYVAEAIWREEMENHRRKVARHLALLLIS